jgi:hypothetical protein
MTALTYYLAVSSGIGTAVEAYLLVSQRPMEALKASGWTED